MRKETVTGIGGVALAFLASQHHTLHMILITLGIGGASAGMMDAFPVVRRLMLLMSAVMTVVMLLSLRKSGMPRSIRLLNGFSVTLTAFLIGWSLFWVIGGMQL